MRLFTLQGIFNAQNYVLDLSATDSQHARGLLTNKFFIDLKENCCPKFSGTGLIVIHM
jgi:hypothetical protein